MKKLIFYFFLLVCSTLSATAEDGYRLWLRYDKVSNKALYDQYRLSIKQLIFPGSSATLAAAQEELANGLKGLLALELTPQASVTANGKFFLGGG